MERFINRRVSVKLNDGNHRNGVIQEIFASGVIGERGGRPIYGETAKVVLDQPHGGVTEISTLRLTFI